MVVLVGLGVLGRWLIMIKPIAMIAKTSAIAAIFFADNNAESQMVMGTLDY